MNKEMVILEIAAEDIKEVAKHLRKARGKFPMSNDVSTLFGNFCRTHDPMSEEENYREMGMSEFMIKELIKK